MFDFLKSSRRDQLRAKSFPKAWLAIISRNVPLYRLLTPEQQRLLRGHVQVLIAEKKFEGCRGLRINDEIRVTIAAHAALLMLGGKPHYYPFLDVILVYPTAFMVRAKRSVAGGTSEATIPMLGEAWADGAVILSWDHALKQARNRRGRNNVLLHEFAHQLDMEDGATDGTPVLERKAWYATWVQALKPEFDRLVANPRKGFLEPYAATNPAEFFAVATEVFFQAPYALKRHHPRIYAELSRFYGLDLARHRNRPA